VWQWVRHNVQTVEGRTVTPEWVTSLLEEDVSRAPLRLILLLCHIVVNCLTASHVELESCWTVGAAGLI